MEFEKIDILDLLPQRPPFVLIDRLVHFDEHRTVTRFTVPEGHLFCEEGCLQAAGLIENIAQTCAARMGYINLINAERVKWASSGPSAIWRSGGARVAARRWSRRSKTSRRSSA